MVTTAADPERQDLAARIAAVRRRVAAAAERAGRPPDAVSVVAVTKGVAPERVRVAVELGLRDLGENRAQELRAKMASLADLPARWHFVGRLQTNKVRDVVGRVALIHSLDRWELALAIDRRARSAGLRQECLVQVNVSGEATKAGVAPEEAADFVRRVARLQGIRVVGLMTIAPPADHPEEVRPVFRRLRQLCEELRREGLEGVEMRHLSMGMSGDFEVAIEEGATLVRIGTALFGPRGAAQG